jgi:hypothetical protein
LSKTAKGSSSARLDLCHVRPPAAEIGNVARAGDRFGFDQKTFDGAAVAKIKRADAERRRHGGDEAAERGLR